MKKLVIIQLFGKPYEMVVVTHRIRRGKIVEIPEEWRGKVTYKQTMRKRDSKQGQMVSYKSKKQR